MTKKPIGHYSGKLKEIGGSDYVAPASLGSGSGAGTKFLREDNSWQPVSAGISVIEEAEIDFGTVPISEKSFVIPNAAITPSMKIITSVSYAAPTGKDQDELEMDDLQLRALAGTGNFTLYVRAADGSYLADKFLINYIFA